MPLSLPVEEVSLSSPILSTALSVGLNPPFPSPDAILEEEEEEGGRLVWLLAVAMESNMAATEGDSSRCLSPPPLGSCFPFFSELEGEAASGDGGVTSSFSSALIAAANPSFFPPFPESPDGCCLGLRCCCEGCLEGDGELCLCFGSPRPAEESERVLKGREKERELVVIYRHALANII